MKPTGGNTTVFVGRPRPEGESGRTFRSPSLRHPGPRPPEKKNLNNDESPAKQSAQRRLRVPVGGSRAAVAGGLPLYKRVPEQEQEAVAQFSACRLGWL